MSIEFYRGSPGKFDSRTLSRETLSRWTGRIPGESLRGVARLPERDVRGLGGGLRGTSKAGNANTSKVAEQLMFCLLGIYGHFVGTLFILTGVQQININVLVRILPSSQQPTFQTFTTTKYLSAAWSLMWTNVIFVSLSLSLYIYIYIHIIFIYIHNIFL